MQKGRSDFRAEKARAHDYHMLFGEKNFANRQCVAITSEVNDISQICSGHLWTASATSGSDAGLAKLNGCPFSRTASRRSIFNSLTSVPRRSSTPFFLYQSSVFSTSFSIEVLESLRKDLESGGR